MNPPIYATLISIPLALIPYMKQYIFNGSGAILTGNVYHALTVLGSCVSPMINILLGCNLSQGYPPTATIRWSELISIMIGKEVIMPLIGLGVVGGFYWADILDRVAALMLMIIYAGPTSLQLLMICTNHKNQVDNISKLYLIMYATAAIPMMLWTMGFLVILYD
jgi:predicted permease